MEGGSQTSIEKVVTATVAGSEAASVAEAVVLIAAAVLAAAVAEFRVGTVAGVEAETEIEMEAKIVDETEAETGIEMEAEIVDEIETVAGVEMEVVLGSDEFEAGPMERHNCYMVPALGFHYNFEKYWEDLVHWGKLVFEACVGLVECEGCEGRLMLLTRRGSKSRSYPGLLSS